MKDISTLSLFDHWGSAWTACCAVLAVSWCRARNHPKVNDAGLQLEWWEMATGDPSVGCNSYFQWQSSYWEAISCKHLTLKHTPVLTICRCKFYATTDWQTTHKPNKLPKKAIHKKNSAQGFTKLLSWFLDCFPKINPKSHWRTYASGWYELPRLLYCPWLQLILNRRGVLSGPGLITLWIIHRSISMGDHDPCILTDGVPGTGYTATPVLRPLHLPSATPVSETYQEVCIQKYVVRSRVCKAAFIHL